MRNTNAAPSQPARKPRGTENVARRAGEESGMKVRCHTRRQDSCRLQRFPDSAERTICCEPMPKRERYVWVCTNRRPDGHPKGSCGEKGAEALQRDIKSAVAQAGLHHTVRVCASSCIDLCWKGISVAVMPDKAFLGGTTPEDIP